MDINDELRRIISQMMSTEEIVNKKAIKLAKYSKAKMNAILKASKPVPFAEPGDHEKVDRHTMKVCLFRLCDAAKWSIDDLCEKMSVDKRMAVEWRESVQEFLEGEDDADA